MARLTGAVPGERVLDVAAGTGNSTLALAKYGATVVSSDFTISMLNIAHSKFKQKRVENRILGLVGADAQNLPFKNSSFDAVTICYGIRNLEQRAIAYAEFRRVLKPGGRLVILEFSTPQWGWIRWLYNLYSQFFLVKLGGLLSGNPLAYTYLRESIKSFPSQPVLARELQSAGYFDVSWQNLSFGIVALHMGRA